MSSLCFSLPPVRSNWKSPASRGFNPSQMLSTSAPASWLRSYVPRCTATNRSVLTVCEQTGTHKATASVIPKWEHCVSCCVWQLFHLCGPSKPISSSEERTPWRGSHCVCQAQNTQHFLAVSWASCSRHTDTFRKERLQAGDSHTLPVKQPWLLLLFFV